jgi:hypothetical protein
VGHAGALAISSANLYSAVQPGGSLYGLQASNPVETDVAYGNSAGGQGNAPASGSSLARPRIRWSASALAGSMFSVEASRSM